MKIKGKTKKVSLFAALLVTVFSFVFAVGTAKADPSISTTIELAGKLQSTKLWLTRVKTPTKAIEGLLQRIHLEKDSVTSSRIKNHTIKDEDLKHEYLKLKGGKMKGDIDMDENLIINIGDNGTDFTATGGLNLAGDLDVDGDADFAQNVVIGSSTSATETLENAGFVMGGDDLFVAGMLGVEGSVYTDGSFIAGASTTYGDGFITDSGGDFVFTLGAGGDDLNVLTGNIKLGDGTPDDALDGEDLYVEGGFEVDGDANLDGDLDVAGITVLNGTAYLQDDLDVDGDTELDGDVDLGDDSGDTIVFNGLVNSHIIPEQADAWDLGSATNEWANAYFGDDTIFIGMDQDITLSWDDVNGALEMDGGMIAVGEVDGGTDTASLDGDLFVEDALEVDGETDLDGALDVAGATTLNGNVALGDGIADDIDFNGYVISDILPDADGTYDLGSSGVRWASGYFDDLYVSDNSIYIGDGNDVVIAYDEAGEDRLEITGPNADVYIQNDLEVDGDTDLDGELNVEDAVTMQSTLNVQDDADFDQDVDVDGSTYLNGNVELGDGTADDITFNGYVDSHILPDADGIYNLGSSGVRWASAYVDDLYVSDNSIYLGDDNNVILAYDETGDDRFEITGANADVYMEDSLEVDGATDLDSTLNVQGATVLQSTLNGQGAVDFDNTLNVDLATTLNSTLDVDGATTLNSTLDVDLATTLNGDVDLGDTTGDDIVFNGYVASHILPDANGTYDLGSDTMRWRDVYVDDLYVSDNSIYIGNDNDVMIAYDETNDDRLEITGLNADVYIEDNLEVDGNTDLDGDLDVDGDTDLDDTTVDGTLDVTGAVDMDSTLNVDGDVDFTETGGGSGTADFDVAGYSQFAGTVEVDGLAFFDAAVDMDSTLDVLGATTLRNTLNGQGAVDFDSTLNVDGASTFGSTVTVGVDGTGYDVTLHSDTLGDNMLWDASAAQLVITGTNATTALSVADGNVVFADNLTVNGAGDFDTTLNVDGATTLNGTLDVDLATTLNGDVTLGDGVADDITFSGYVASHILPDADGTYDLGSTGVRWRDGYFDDLFVSDSSITIGDDNDVVISWDDTDVALEMTGGLISIGEDSGTTATGAGDLFVADAVEVDGNADLDGDLDVDGTANLDVTDIDGTLNVAGDTDFTATGGGSGTADFDVAGYAQFAGTVEVDGAADFDSTLDVDGDTELDDTDVEGTLDVVGAITVGIDGTGHDVTFHSDTLGDNMLWDQSAAQLVITGTNATTALNVADGNVVIADDLTVSGITDLGTTSIDSLTMDGNIDMATNLILNIGAAGTDFTGTGGLTLADALTVTAGGATITAGGFIVDAGDGRFDEDLVVGGSTATSETLANAGFVMGGDDLFVAGMAGVEGSIYTDAGLVVGASTTYADGSITDSGGDFTFALNAGTDDLNVTTGNFVVGNGIADTALNGEDAYIEGTVEVDGAADLDGTLNVAGAVTAQTTLGVTGVSTLGGGADIDGDTDINDGNWSITGAGAADFDSTLNVDGATTLDALTVGVDGTSFDVTFHSDTAGDNMLWDESAAQLVITGTDATTALNVADGNVVIADDLTVSGSTSLASLGMTGDLDMATNIITNIGAAGTDFTVTGGLTLADTLTVSAGGASITGAATLAGASFSGTADFNSVVDVVGATVTGDVIPTADSTYDLGTTGVRWANGYFDDLYVSDNSIHIGDGDDVQIAYDGTVDNRLEITGDNVYIADALEVDGAVDLDSDLDVDGTANLDVTDIDGTLNVAGDTDFTATGGGTGTANFDVAGYAQFAGAVEVDGAADLDSTLDVAGATTIDDTLTVGADGTSFDVTFHSDTAGDNMLWDESLAQLVITGTDGTTALNVADGNVVIGDNLTVSGTTSLAGLGMTGNLDMATNVILNIGAAGTDFTGTGGLTLADALTVSSGGANITGTATFNSLADFDGGVDLSGSTVTGDIIPSATTYDLGSTTAEFASMYVGDNTGINFGLDQNALIAYDELTDDRLEITGNNANVYLEDALEVDGLADLDGGADIDGETEITDTQWSITNAGTANFVNTNVTTDLDVDGIANLDVTDIDGTLNVAGVSTLAAGADIDGDTDINDGQWSITSAGAASFVTLGASGASTLAGASFSGTADFNSVVDIQGATITGHYVPTTANTYNLGSTASEIANVYVGDDNSVYFGSNQTGRITYDSGGTDMEIVSTNISLIGTTTTNAVNVTGALDVSGAATLDGNVTLGDTTGDDIVFSGLVNSDIVPDGTDIHDLGSPTAVWAEVYVGDDSLHIGNDQDATISWDNTNQALEIKTDTNQWPVSIGEYAGATTATAGSDLLVAGDLEVNTNVDFDGDLDVDGTANLDNTDIDGTLDVSGATLTGNVVPTGAGTLGTSGSRWSTIYADTVNFEQSLTDTTGANSTITFGTDAGNDVTVSIGNDSADTLNITAETAITDTQWSISGAGGASFATLGVTGASTLAGASFSGTADFNSVVDLQGATVTGAILPTAADTYDLGSTAAEFERAYIGDNGGVLFGNDQDVTIAYDEAGDDVLEITGDTVSIGEYANAATATGDGDLLVASDLEVNATVDFDGSSGSSGSADFDVAGYAQFAGTVEFDGTADFDGSVDIDGETEITDSQWSVSNAGAAIFASVDQGSGTMELPNGTNLPATCSSGEVFHDTNDDACADADAGDGALCICKTANTWALLSNF